MKNACIDTNHPFCDYHFCPNRNIDFKFCKKICGRLLFGNNVNQKLEI